MLEKLLPAYTKMSRKQPCDIPEQVCGENATFDASRVPTELFGQQAPPPPSILGFGVDQLVPQQVRQCRWFWTFPDMGPEQCNNEQQNLLRDREKTAYLKKHCCAENAETAAPSDDEEDQQDQQDQKDQQNMIIGATVVVIFIFVLVFAALMMASIK